MSAVASPIGGLLETAAGPTPADLAELLGAFNEVTQRLQGTHDRLQREVAGLKRELSAANEQLSRSRRLAALGEMAAGIAHEVRNPLSSIGLYARLLEQDLADQPAACRLAHQIGAAVHGLNAVVGDVLNFAREVRVSASPERASELFRRALDACRAEAPPGTEVRRADLQHAGVVVWCDGPLVCSALINLIRNAYQAMGDEVGPGARVLTLDAREDGSAPEGGHVLSVADTGPGVSADALERMFNPFFTTRAAGTGLGLAIVHRIVDAHAGRVAVRNAPAGGAVFELYFPCFPSTAPAFSGGIAQSGVLPNTDAGVDHAAGREQEEGP